MPESDRDTTEYTTRHVVDIAAPAAHIYTVIADAENWPIIFPPAVHVRREPRPGGIEVLDIWATAHDKVKAWRSQRELDATNRTVTFCQLVTAPPVASMSGTWRIETNESGTSTVILDHRFTAVADEPDSVTWIEQALDTNSTAELAAVEATVLGRQDGSVVTLAFSDSVTIRSAAQPVFDFLYRADLWPERLPHVSRVALSYIDDAQVLEMDTTTDTGEAHTTRSYRVATDRFELAYKQTVLPEGFLAHHGKWTLAETADETLATSHHRVQLDLNRLRGRLGLTDQRDIEQRVRAALGGNSLRTLEAARAFAESPQAQRV
ncbi:SRPBCC family protein [Nocardia vinacea]|uniref:SRPBCC family protein n=1 Tax=Nocardia vinacea TaxID=96468 RepID=A0ABZ1YT17_9NOCA|nr:SRPBCC family protein [Nocardia vinacea]